MWLMTPAVFFSIVQKPEDVKHGTLTVRARVAGYLDNLRSTVLPALSATLAGHGTDYAFRATASREKVARALGQFALQTDYSNFKSEVAKQQGQKRAQVYHDGAHAQRPALRDPCILPICSDQRARVGTPMPMRSGDSNQAP